MDFNSLFSIWQTGLEKNLLGNHPVSRSTESRSPPPAFASDALINISSSSHTQEGNNLPDGYSVAGNGEYSKSAVSEIVEIDVPASAGSYMKSSSPGVRYSLKNLVFSQKLRTVSVFLYELSQFYLFVAVVYSLLLLLHGKEYPL